MSNNGVPIDGQKLRLLRLRKGWSLRDVEDASKALGHTVQFGNLRSYENGTIRPYPRTLFALAQALGVEVDELLKEAA